MQHIYNTIYGDKKYRVQAWLGLAMMKDLF